MGYVVEFTMGICPSTIQEAEGWRRILGIAEIGRVSNDGKTQDETKTTRWRHRGPTVSSTVQGDSHGFTEDHYHGWSGFGCMMNTAGTACQTGYGGSAIGAQFILCIMVILWSGCLSAIIFLLLKLTGPWPAMLCWCRLTLEKGTIPFSKNEFKHHATTLDTKCRHNISKTKNHNYWVFFQGKNGLRMYSPLNARQGFK